MIILDTNVVSESMRRSADPNVVSWLDRHSADDVCITAVTAAALLRGVALLPAGRRRSELATAVAALLEIEFGGRILPFDERAAVNYAALSARRHRAGTPSSVADTMIAAIAEAVGATALVTRNVADFQGAAVDIVDPWTA